MIGSTAARRLCVLAAATLTLGAVVSCSSSTSAVEESTSAAPNGAFPVTIDHKFGSTTIESEPSRVVTAGWNDQDFVLSLGVVPVDTRSWYDEYTTYPWVEDALNGAELPATAASDDIDYEQILQQHPDVIIAIYESIDQETYDRLSQIAPTVVQSADYEDEETPWDVQTLTTGKALGRSAEAEAKVAEVQDRIDAAKAANPAFATSTLVESFGDDGKYLVGQGDPRRAVFDALGFPAQEHTGDTSDEQLELLDRDVLFVNGRTQEEMAENPVFARLPVVTDGRTIYVGGDSVLSGALAYSGPDALLYALDLVVPQLKNALDGDPTTPVEQFAA